MTIATIAVLTFFLAVLFYYQKQDKIYIGYTTVLSLLFTAIIAITLISTGGDSSENLFPWLLLLIIWVLGTVLIYITSQLTLAFEKIHQLCQHIALKDVQGSEKKQTDSPA